MPNNFTVKANVGSNFLKQIQTAVNNHSNLINSGMILPQHEPHMTILSGEIKNFNNAKKEKFKDNIEEIFPSHSVLMVPTDIMLWIHPQNVNNPNPRMDANFLIFVYKEVTKEGVKTIHYNCLEKLDKAYGNGESIKSDHIKENYLPHITLGKIPAEKLKNFTTYFNQNKAQIFEYFTSTLKIFSLFNIEANFTTSNKLVEKLFSFELSKNDVGITDFKVDTVSNHVTFSCAREKVEDLTSILNKLGIKIISKNGNQFSTEPSIIKLNGMIEGIRFTGPEHKMYQKLVGSGTIKMADHYTEISNVENKHEDSPSLIKHEANKVVSTTNKDKYEVYRKLSREFNEQADLFWSDKPSRFTDVDEIYAGKKMHISNNEILNLVTGNIRIFDGDNIIYQDNIWGEDTYG